MKIKTKPFIKRINNINWVYFELLSCYANELDKVLKHDDITVDVSKTKKPRSLSANAYSWVLLEQIAKKLYSTSEEIYIQMLHDYGVKEYNIFRERELEEKKKKYRIVEVKGKVTVIGEDGKKKEAIQALCIGGSSGYDSKQFSFYLEGIIFESKELGLKTMTPQEVNNLLKMMGE